MERRARLVRIESFVHHADPIHPDLFAGRGRSDAGGRWQRRFDHAADDDGHTDTAAAMLVEAIRAMGVNDPDEPNHHGTVAGRGHNFRLDLPDPGLHRKDAPAE
ncbi:hypothetical protein OG948_54230 (plasmid) [Embleya sp. NBC_00888]|uniref:hypothetical protein n=1 Tax=Embleya sp. NBC_00888 TaxID=2975960 RepID=UPI003865A08F|nr:hypothetical protein OG948_54230 [Embleya sp. NBC_00888]